MHLPEPISTDVRDESFAGVTYHIRGQLVPELQLELGDVGVMHEHHVLLWKETGVSIDLKKLPGGVKRKLAGLDFFVTLAKGPGRIAFSRDSPGQCVAMHLAKGAMTWNRFTGPGRLAIQTMFIAPAEAAEGGQGVAAAEGGVVGAVLGGLLKG